MRGASLSAPAHMDAEVLSALGRMARTGGLDPYVVPMALAVLRRTPVVRWPLSQLLAEAWERRANLALPDALYVALARRLGAALLTTDGRLARAPGLPVPTVVVGA